MPDEFVRVLNIDIVFDQDLLRKILQIVGHNHIAATSDRRRQHVTVTRVGQMNRRNEILKILNQSVPRASVHKIPSAMKLLRSKVRPVGKHGSDPFFMDGITPLGSEKIRCGEL